jgi:hypothetical protein
VALPLTEDAVRGGSNGHIAGDLARIREIHRALLSICDEHLVATDERPGKRGEQKPCLWARVPLWEAIARRHALQ